MNTFENKVHDILECPVCFRIPREIPVPACSAGHIVCKQCRSQVSHCPTCRRAINCTNTLVGYISNISQHKCSFFMFGCNHKYSILQIKVHEELCPERTIKCPYRDCKKDVQLKTYREHAIIEECAIDLNRVKEYDVFEAPRNQFKILKLLSSNFPTVKTTFKFYYVLLRQTLFHFSHSQ